MNNIPIIITVLFMAQNSMANQENDGFDFGDVKVRCDCGNEQNHIHQNLGAKWYEKIELPPPPILTTQETLDKANLKSVVVHENTINSQQIPIGNLEKKWYEKVGLPPPPTIAPQSVLKQVPNLI